jgi:ring-1,2-phenylacetyl-CoA epoxidase subunit PaaD
VVNARSVVAAVVDPEMPVVTIEDLGVLREVTEHPGASVTVTITPTYTACPAVGAIASDIAAALRDAGYDSVAVRTVLDPPWTTDWISPSGRRKLAAAGIAPPRPAPDQAGPVPIRFGAKPDPVPCPGCGSMETEERSRFGATACRSLWQCRACGDPFEYVKPL